MLGDATRKAEEEFSSRNAIVPPSVINMEFPNLDNWESVPDNYCVLPYILFHPLAQIPKSLKETIFYCPLCLANTARYNALRSTDVWKDGRTARLNPQIIFDATSPVILVAKLYKCGFGHDEIPATHPDVISQFENVYIPFELSHRYTCF